MYSERGCEGVVNSSMECLQRTLLPVSALGLCMVSNQAVAAALSRPLAPSVAIATPLPEQRHKPSAQPNLLRPEIQPGIQPEIGPEIGPETRSDMGLDTQQPPALPVEFAQQPDPNDERFLQPRPEPPEPIEEEPVLPDTPAPDAPSDESAPPTESPVEAPDDSTEVQFFVERIEVLGSTVFDEEDFAPITAPVEGREVTLSDLQNVADAITQLYLDEGYLTSRAILVDQVIRDGVVQIQIVEGRIGEIQIQGNERLRDRYIRRRIELGATTPLRTDRLEDQLRLLRADPLLENVEASLRAGDELGESILIVRVTEADAFIGELRADNYSPPSVGSDRVGLTLGYGNVSGLGDALVVSYDRTAQGGAQVADFSYRIPVNPMNGTVQLRTVIDRNEVIQEPFDVFDIEGESERYEVSYRQPLVRSPREEFALSLGFAYRDGQVLAFDLIPLSLGANEEGVTRTSVLRFGQDYVKRDVQGAWALRSQFSIGIDVFNATVNENLPDSRFVSWLGQAQRVQRIGDDHLLIAQLDMQFTPDALLSSEQFVIGGGQSLRGFRQNARAGDNGIRFSLEDRITLVRNEAGAPIFQLAPFVDLGTVWNDGDNVDLPDQRFLAGIGTGILWEMFPNFNVRLDFTLPLVDLDDRGDNIQDDGIYFSVNYQL